MPRAKGKIKKCPSCGWQWVYGGSMQRPTCPSCKKSMPVEVKA